MAGITKGSDPLADVFQATSDDDILASIIGEEVAKAVNKIEMYVPQQPINPSNRSNPQTVNPHTVSLAHAQSALHLTPTLEEIASNGSNQNNRSNLGPDSGLVILKTLAPDAFALLGSAQEQARCVNSALHALGYEPLACVQGAPLTTLYQVLHDFQRCRERVAAMQDRDHSHRAQLAQLGQALMELRDLALAAEKRSQVHEARAKELERTLADRERSFKLQLAKLERQQNLTTKRDTQYQHDIRKLEKTIRELQERLMKALAENRGGTNSNGSSTGANSGSGGISGGWPGGGTITLLNPLPPSAVAASLKRGSKLSQLLDSDSSGRGATEPSGSRSGSRTKAELELEIVQASLAESEKRNCRLLLENRSLRHSLAKLRNDMQGILGSPDALPTEGKDGGDSSSATQPANPEDEAFLNDPLLGNPVNITESAANDETRHPTDQDLGGEVEGEGGDLWSELQKLAAMQYAQTEQKTDPSSGLTSLSPAHRSSAEGESSSRRRSFGQAVVTPTPRRIQGRFSQADAFTEAFNEAALGTGGAAEPAPVKPSADTTVTYQTPTGSRQSARIDPLTGLITKLRKSLSPGGEGGSLNSGEQVTASRVTPADGRPKDEVTRSGRARWMWTAQSVRDINADSIVSSENKRNLFVTASDDGNAEQSPQTLEELIAKLHMLSERQAPGSPSASSSPSNSSNQRHSSLYSSSQE